MKLTLRPRIVLPNDHPLAQYNPLQYDVAGLPPNRIVWIGPSSPTRAAEGVWSIMPVTVIDGAGAKGKWTGDYDSAEAALAAVDEQFLQDPTHWSDLQ